MSAAADSLRADVRGYIQALNGCGAAIGDGDDIIRKGIIASMQLLDLINHLADTYQVEIEEADVFDGHFASVDAIVAFLGARAG